MKRYGKRLTALLLALCLALGLAACGSGGDQKGGEAEPLSGTVYVPAFVQLDTDFDYISGGCCNGEDVFLSASTSVEEELTDPDTGETYTSYYSKDGIYRVSLETGEVTELENYEPSYSFDNSEDGWFSIDSVRAGADGTLWVSERASIYDYNLPDDFDEETGSKWEYQTSTDVSLMRQLDATGKELQSVDTSTLREKLGEDVWVSSTIVDGEGCLYAYTSAMEGGEAISVFGPEMNLLFTIEVDMYGELIQLGDGTIGARRRNQDGEMLVSVIDKTTKGWGATEYPLPYAANNIYGGSDKFLFYYNSGDSLYGYDAETQEGKRLLSWTDSDINMDQLVFFTFLPDGRVAAMTQNWGEEGPSVELAVLTETERSLATEKTILTYACMGMGSDERSSIIKFNKTSDKYRIEIHDYSEYATEEDYRAGLTKLNTEILAGNAPDILSVSGMPLRQYEAKGLLEDLWPYIDSDPEISREDLMERVFQAAERDGKLYQAFESFAISTVAGSPKVVGDGLGWTLEELRAALETMPEGCAIFSDYETRDLMLQYLLSLNVDAYVDWETGECRFDSEEFKSALEFCNSFPLDYNRDPNAEYEDEPSRIASGKQMLKTMTLDSFRDLQIYEAMYAGEEGLKTVNVEYDYSGPGSYTVVVSDSASGGISMNGNASQRLRPGKYVTFKGFPMVDGSCGSSFTLSNSLAMSSTCKDKEGAWSYIREMLLPNESRRFYTKSYSWGFPSNKADFDAAAEQDMTPEYITDADGKQVLDQEGAPVEQSKGGWTWSNLNIETVATTQQEYDQVMELYNAIDSISGYDTELYEIIKDQAAGYFNGDKSLDETADLIQRRVQLYINENR